MILDLAVLLTPETRLCMAEGYGRLKRVRQNMLFAVSAEACKHASTLRIGLIDSQETLISC